jgi:hypothetical protein
MATTDGHRSTFPTTLDSWGDAFTNDSCTAVEAEDWNQIQDALYQLERHNFHVLQTGTAAHPHAYPSGANRPRMLIKVWEVTLTGGSQRTKSFTVPALSSDEQDFFAGTPLASTNALHLQIRKLNGDDDHQRAYHCALESPVDPTGNTAISLRAANLRHGNGEYQLGNGTYVVTLMILN